MTTPGVFDKCRTCGEYGFLPHNCAPLWELWVDHYDEGKVPADDEVSDDVVTSRGYDEEVATQKYVTRNVSDLEYPELLTIFVRPQKGGEWKKVVVERTISYTATIED